MTKTLKDLLAPYWDEAGERFPDTEYIGREYTLFARSAFRLGTLHALSSPIVITSVEELEALPIGAVILAGKIPKTGEVSREVCYVMGQWQERERLIETFGSVTVLYLPEETS